MQFSCQWFYRNNNDFITHQFIENFFGKTIQKNGGYIWPNMKLADITEIIARDKKKAGTDHFLT